MIAAALDAMLFRPWEPQLVSIFMTIALVIPSLAAAVRRLHDTDRSGWWVLLGAIPVIGLLVLFFLYLQRGTPEPNRFGSGVGASLDDFRTSGGTGPTSRDAS